MNILFVLLLSLVSTSYGVVQGKQDPPEPKNCKKELNRLLSDWKTKNEWSLRLNTAGKKEWWSPTENVGSWVRLATTKDGYGFATLSSKIQQLQVTWKGKRCEPALSVRPFAYSKKQNVFNDADLHRLLQTTQKGFIYIWSPHMPLSLEGIPRVETLAKKYKVPLTILLDSKADPDFAERQLKKAKLSKKYLLRMDTFELVMRNAQIHFPNMFIYKDKMVLSKAYPGLMGQGSYESILKQELF